MIKITKLTKFYPYGIAHAINSPISIPTTDEWRKAINTTLKKNI